MKKMLKNIGICSLAVTLLASCVTTTSFAALKASYVEFTDIAASGETPAQVKTQAYVWNDSDSNADGSLIIASYDENNNLTDVKISKLSGMTSGQENFISASLDATTGGTYKAFLWEGDNNIPIKPLASKIISAETALLKGISVDGQLISDFSADTTTYNVQVPQGAVVPVIKGVTSDNSVYTTTSYGDISSDGQSVSAQVTAKQGDRTETYTVNVVCEPIDVIKHAIDIESEDKTWGVYENLHGAASPAAGARASSDYTADECFFNTVPSDLAGCDYIVGKRDVVSAYQFRLSNTADVLVLSSTQLTDMTEYDEQDGNNMQMYYMKPAFIKMMKGAGIAPTYADALLWQSKYGTDGSAAKTALADKYNISADAFKNAPAKWVVNEGAKYVYRYTQRFEAGSVVTIPASPTQGVGHVVVVKPVQAEKQSLVEQITNFQYLVGGMSYTKYCEHIGKTPNPDVKSTATIDKDGYKLRKFTEGAYLCGNATNRVITTINKLTGFENAYYIAPDYSMTGYDGESVTVDQSADSYVAANDRRWITAAYTGLARTVDASQNVVVDFDKKEAKWFSFKVNKDCEVIVLSSVTASGSPQFCKPEEGWVNSYLSDDAYIAHKGTALLAKNTYRNMHVKEYKAGNIVELYNENTGDQRYPIPYMTIIRFK